MGPGSLRCFGRADEREARFFSSLGSKSPAAAAAAPLPAKWRQRRCLPEPSPICACAEVPQCGNPFHWFRGNSPKYGLSLATAPWVGGAKCKCLLATARFPLIGQPLRDRRSEASFGSLRPPLIGSTARGRRGNGRAASAKGPLPPPWVLAKGGARRWRTSLAVPTDWPGQAVHLPWRSFAETAPVSSEVPTSPPVPG